MSLLKVNNITDLGDDPVLTDGVLDVTPPAILQVVSTTKTDAFSQSISSASQAGSNVTGLEVTITPTSASNKLLVMVSLTLGSRYGTAAYTLFRDGSATSFIGDTAGSRPRLTGNSSNHGTNRNVGTPSLVALDDAVGTSSTTYGIRLYNSNDQTETIMVNRTYSDSDNGQYPRTVSSITVMEVAG